MATPKKVTKTAAAAAPSASTRAAMVAKATKPAKKTPTSKTLRVADLMTKSLQVCLSDDDLATAANKMWTGDCGALPVVDEHARACGWITDRDICMALGMKASRSSDLQVDQVMSTPVHQCAATESVKSALSLFENHRVRRLAVVDADERVVGVLSLNDLIRAAKARASSSAPGYADVIAALKAVSEPHAAVIAS